MTADIIEKYHDKRYAKKEDKPRFIPAVKSESAYFVLCHVIYRTFQFEKCFEFIRAKDILNGIPTNAIPGYGLSEPTVKRVLNWLSPPHSDYLVKLKLLKKGKRIITPIYGLNIPGFLKLMQVCWIASTKEANDCKDDYEYRPNRKPSNLMLRGRCLLECCINFSIEYEEAFNFLTKCVKPIDDIELFKENLCGYFPVSLPNSFFKGHLAECKKINYLRQLYLKGLEKGKCFENYLSA